MTAPLLASACAYKTIDWAVFFYFLVGSILLVGSIFGYLHVNRLSKHGYETVQDENDLVETSPRMGLEMLDPYSHDLGLIDSSPGMMIRPTAASHLKTSQKDEVTHDLLVQNDPIPRSKERSKNTSALVAVLNHIRGPTLCIFLTFVVTLTMFPAWTSQLQSRWRCQSNWRLANDLFTPLTFVLFNAGDLLGRLLSGRYPMHDNTNISSKLVMAALLRIPLGLLLFTCTGATEVTAFVIPLDLYSFGIQLLFAVSNGYLVTLSFAHAPTLLQSAYSAAQQRMSEILSFALSLGLLVGSFCSYPVSQLGT
jgi:hypothetical protein